MTVRNLKLLSDDVITVRSTSVLCIKLFLHKSKASIISDRLIYRAKYMYAPL